LTDWSNLLVSYGEGATEAPPAAETPRRRRKRKKAKAEAEAEAEAQQQQQQQQQKKKKKNPLNPLNTRCRGPFSTLAEYALRRLPRQRGTLKKVVAKLREDLGTHLAAVGKSALRSNLQRALADDRFFSTEGQSDGTGGKYTLRQKERKRRRVEADDDGGAAADDPDAPRFAPSPKRTKKVVRWEGLRKVVEHVPIERTPRTP